MGKSVKEVLIRKELKMIFKKIDCNFFMIYSKRKIAKIIPMINKILRNSYHKKRNSLNNQFGQEMGKRMKVLLLLN